MEAAMSNPLVLRCIFTHLPLSSLLDCRLVNKFWNYEACLYIRDFRRCNANISASSTCPCTDLMALNNLLEDLTIATVINSLSIHIRSPWDESCAARRRPEDSDYAGALLGKLPLKYLSIIWDHGHYCEGMMCDSEIFLLFLFQLKIPQLHTLELYGLCQPVNHFQTETIPTLPVLKVLDIESLEKWAKCEELLSKIVQQAPNLEKVRGRFEPKIGEGFPQDKYSLLDHFFLSITSDDEYLVCLKLVEANPALSILHLGSSFKTKPKYKNKYFHVLEQLMTNCCKSLNNLWLDSVAFPFTQLGLPALVNLKGLKISIKGSSHQVVSFLQSLDYPEFLPALTDVDIRADMVRHAASRNVVERVPLPATFRPSITTKSLKLDLDVNTQLLQDLSSIFPNVNSLVVDLNSKAGRPAFPYGDLWSCWPQLESIKVLDRCESLGVDYDGEFLGVNPKEVELLRELDNESVGKLNIVPTHPSMLTLQRKLRVLFVGFQVLSYK